MRIPLISLVAAGALALGGCAYGGVGIGYGDPYSSYGYGNQYGYGGGYGGYGYNSGGYGYGGYGSPYGYGAGYGSPYYGWYNNYYYPGTGYYVYDSYRRPIRWSDSQRNYWLERQQRARSQGVRAVTSPNWTQFERPRRATTTNRVTARDRMTQSRAASEQRRLERSTERTERRAARTTARTSDSNDDRRGRRRPN
jgi:hypothetical protein